MSRKNKKTNQATTQKYQLISFLQGFCCY